MKPKYLKPPFKWDTRCVMLRDGLFFVPEYYHSYEDYTFPGWNAPEVFGNDNPVHIEYCSGNGLWIAEKAAENPDVNWVAVEKLFKRVRKIWSKKMNLGLDNLFIVCGEGYTTSQYYFPKNSVEAFYINFPDPWPKKRQYKHRLVQPRFAEEMHRTLLPEGKVTLVTDDPEYSDVMVDVMRGHQGFEPAHNSPYFVNEHPGYGSSYFEELWRNKGKPIRYHQFSHKVA